MKNIFKSKIICKLCGKHYRLKTEKGRRNFICGGYSNKTGCKTRNVVSEDYLVEFINRRFKLDNREGFNLLMDEILNQIQIEDKYNFRVLFNDNSFMEMNKNSKKILY